MTAAEILIAVAQIEATDTEDKVRVEHATRALEILNKHWGLPGRRQGAQFPTIESAHNQLSYFHKKTLSGRFKNEFEARHYDDPWTAQSIKNLGFYEEIAPILNDEVTLEAFLRQKSVWMNEAVSVFLSSILWNMPKSQSKEKICH